MGGSNSDINAEDQEYIKWQNTLKKFDTSMEKQRKELIEYNLGLLQQNSLVAAKVKIDKNVVQEEVQIPTLSQVKCPTCREISAIDLLKCRTHAKSGKLPDDFDKKAKEVEKLGLQVQAACTICFENYADVTLPKCGHNDCCYNCIVNLAK